MQIHKISMFFLQIINYKDALMFDRFKQVFSYYIDFITFLNKYIQFELKVKDL